jgi:hypothetical protein
MPARKKKMPMSKFPLRLMPSVRKTAESYSGKEGVSLNQFINLAVAEKLAHMQHEEWISKRPKLAPELIERGLAALSHPTNIEPEPWDRLPEGYEPVSR